MNARVLPLLLLSLFALAACTLTPPPNGPDVPLFADVSEAAGISAQHRAVWNEFTNRPFDDGYLASGQAWGDYDADGWPDLYVTGNLAPNVLYHNNQDGTFSVSPFSESVSLPDTVSGGAVWADYDNDGWVDLYVLAHGGNVLFRNLGREGFVDVTDAAGVGDPGKGTTAAWGDYDEDGFLDLYVANWACYPKCDPVDFEQSQDRLYHNNGDGTFTDASESLVHEKLLGAAFSASFVDYDNDGDSDLYVINDKLHNPIGNVLWRNDGPGCGHWCWTDVSTEAGADAVVHGMGLATADYDNDGDLDFFFTNMVEHSWLLQNQGDGSFAPADASAGIPQDASEQVGWGTGFFDYDNDGWMDIFVATTAFVKLSPMQGPIGMMLPYPNFLYRNNGDGTFRDVTPPLWKFQPVATMGFATADYDRDGRVDFVEGDWNQGYRLFHNQGNIGAHNNWLSFKLTGGGPINRDAIGARVFVETRNGVTRMQEVKAGSSLGSGNDTTLHFGLGRSRLKRVAVVWPNGVVSELGPLPLNQRWEIDYASVAEADVYEDVTASAGITATHRGSWRMFKPDFTEGYLGVGQAWGDYDNDGWLDLYVTGNLDPNVLFHNEGDGTFSVSPWSEALSMPDAKSGGAVWADYDNDGWKDLYVVAHGPNALFHNEQGAGFREVADEAGVADPGKGSTATWGDYDNDGLLDLYIANWSCAPECNPVDLNLATDRLYHNNGDGTFEDVTHLLVHEKLLGAGFTAAFTDYDDDGDADIYVVNDALMNPIGNVMWRNDGPGCGGWCWTDASAESGTGLQVEGMGLAVGDMDNDLQQDFYFTNMVNPAVLLTNQGEGSFMDLAETAGVTGGPGGPVGWATIFLDYNNDGWQDIFMATTEFRNLNRETPPDGMHFPRANLIFRNNGTGVFFSIQPRSWTEHPHPSMGAARADYDRDGWEDLVTGDWNEGYRLYRNRGLSGAGNNWIRFRLVGGADVNRDAVGARVYVTTDDGRTQMQEVITGGSLGAGNDTALHFGLGRAQVVNVSVRWPNGVEEELGPLAPGREWTVEYTSSK